jgi:hypothetical protein
MSVGGVKLAIGRTVNCIILAHMLDRDNVLGLDGIGRAD